MRRRPMDKLKQSTSPEAAMAYVLQVGKDLLQGFTDPYRPEKHYMRGPGPKWRAKHGQAKTP